MTWGTLRIQILAKRVGWIRVVALLLLTAAAALASTLSPIEYHALTKTRQAITNQRLATANSKSVAAQQPEAISNLERFHRALGDDRAVDGYIRDIFMIAGDLNISLDEGRYDRTHSVAGYSTLAVELPIAGTYQAIRDFCQQVLVKYPFVSLDDITFKRENSSREQLDARIRFTFFLSGERSIDSSSVLANRAGRT